MKGAKHQFYNPSEIPGYKPSKVFNPNSSNHRNRTDSQFMSSSSSDIQSNQIIINGNNLNQNRSYDQNRQQYHINSNNNGSYSDYLIKNQQLMNTYRFHQPSSNGSASLYQFFNSINTKSFAEMFNLAKNNTNIFDNSFLNHSSSSSVGGTTTNTSMNSSVNYSPPQAQQYSNNGLLIRGFKPIATLNQMINGSQYRPSQQQSNNIDAKINARNMNTNQAMNQIYAQQPHYHYQSAHPSHQPPAPPPPSHIPATIHHLQYIQPQYKHFNQISINPNVVNPSTPLVQNVTSQSPQTTNNTLVAAQQTPQTPAPTQITQIYYTNNQSPPQQTSLATSSGTQTQTQTYYVNS